MCLARCHSQAGVAQREHHVGDTFASEIIQLTSKYSSVFALWFFLSIDTFNFFFFYSFLTEYKYQDKILVLLDT